MAVSGNRCVIRAATGRLVCLSAASGAKRWEWDEGSPPFGKNLGERIVNGCLVLWENRQLRVLDIGRGPRLQTILELPDPVRQAVAAKDRIYVLTANSISAVRVFR